MFVASFLNKIVCELGIVVDKLNELASGCGCWERANDFFSYTNDIVMYGRRQARHVHQQVVHVYGRSHGDMCWFTNHVM